ncbi:IMPACT family protein [Dietzia timorensis]|uniref:IMPACT family member YvyE n=1 Tax=Dietzia timorensis TaxID=499555 RepID=A0A173LL38_9ACTN|nr:YigZ family protein [Dietzia timorensis]ANI92191.1 IMPACT family member YvyE [Dietzia timorensis]
MDAQRDSGPLLTLRRGAPALGEYEEKRSKFVCLLERVDDEEAARAVVAAQRKAYPDARHHCSAFVIDQIDTTPIVRSSDDGEPSGTAGTPMLDQLQGAGLSDVVAVVVRWFGGTKLGTGGLVRAYGNAVSEAIDAARENGLMQVVTTQCWNAQVGHEIAGRFEADIRAMDVEVLDVDYGAKVTIRIATDEIGPAGALLAALTSGGAEWQPDGVVRMERPVS